MLTERKRAIFEIEYQLEVRCRNRCRALLSQRAPVSCPPSTSDGWWTPRKIRDEPTPGASPSPDIKRRVAARAARSAHQTRRCRAQEGGRSSRMPARKGKHAALSSRLTSRALDASGSRRDRAHNPAHELHRAHPRNIGEAGSEVNCRAAACCGRRALAHGAGCLTPWCSSDDFALSLNRPTGLSRSCHQNVGYESAHVGYPATP
jgi:hypothetical protein